MCELQSLVIIERLNRSTQASIRHSSTKLRNPIHDDRTGI